MRITVIGAGAVGGWLAATLAKGGADVALVARGATLEHIQRHGLTLLSGERRETFPLPAAERAADLPRPDAIILAAKTYAFSEIVTAAAPVLSHGPLLVTAMNGLPWWFLQGLRGPLENQRLESVDPGGRAAALLGPVRPVGAVVHASMRAEGPGVIRLAAVDRLILGESSGDVSRETSALNELVNAGGSQSVLTEDIRRDIWAKLWGNMNMNPVSALARLTANGIFGEPRLLALVRDMMTEFVAVGERLGLPLPMTVDQRLEVTRRLGDFRTSMLNDVEAGRPLEVEGLLGVVVELADKLGQPVPASRVVYALARGLNRGR
jgi:2-dehydropantoate 2-reductase